MQNLRRSLQNKSSSGGLSPRAPAALAPPRKVIKALYDYNSQQNEELSFTKGDFFHVVGNEDDEDWYEAFNPVTGARGYVPVTYFQILEKNQRNSSQSLEDAGNDSGSFTDPVAAHNLGQPQQQQQHHSFQQQHHHHQPSAQAAPPQKPLPKCQPLYGIVLYDFGAERPDELDAKVGDAILVIAQSNEEWYVAKPIGRLGGPGLIPVSFVEIRDMVTGKPINVQEMLRQTGTAIPRVEEWKKQAMDQNTGPTIQQLKNKMSRDMKSQQQQRDPAMRRLPSQDLDANRRMTGRDDFSSARSTGAASIRSNGNGDYESIHSNNDTDSFQIVNASVESFHYEDDQYWFTVRVELASGATRNLFRLYEDFYNFHIALLEEFPVESGRVGDQPRILPFMPIPLQVVNDAVSASRRADLDGYVQDLCRLPARITQHPLVERLFAVREGDTETHSGAGATRSTSPSMGRSTPSSNSMNYGSPSPAQQQARSSPSATAAAAAAAAGGGGPRGTFTKSQQGAGGSGYRVYGDDPSSSASASPSLRSQSSFPISAPLSIGSSSEEMIKLKISYQEDIMAMRIPVSINFRSLQQKILERLNTEQKDLSYRDDRGDFATIQNDGDVREAIDRSGGKLMIYVD
ncbi:bud emergence protein 1 [Mortierella sp. GBA30]|nr:bud emergence protein 1 [Mortierella sp. GBA30]